MHLRNLFNLVIQHWHVPAGFGGGVIVPLVKVKCGDFLNCDNHRGITISSIISKMFELWMLSKIDKYLVTNEQQFGLKKGVGCSHAVYTLQNAVNYFCRLIEAVKCMW